MTTRSRNLAALTALAALLATIGCRERPSAARAAVQKDAVTGEPACAGPTVHDKHVATFRCDVCHPTGATFGFDLPFTFPRGTTTAGGTLVRNAGTPPSCTVACHFPNGAAAKAVTWDTPGPLACTACHDTARLPVAHPAVSANATRADCQGCHQTAGHTDGQLQFVGHSAAWMDTTSPGFHASSANQGLSSCQGCHGADLRGGTAGVSCGSCHDTALPAGVTTWAENCVMCHGGTEDATGAPPRATWGNAADAVRIGAHAKHVVAGPLAPAADCSLCHQRPADAFASGHLDAGPAEVVFAGLAASGVTPSWTRSTATCASTYCHGGRLGGGTNTSPVWTNVGTGEVACGTCHGLPPPPPHPAASGLTTCITCHPATMSADGSVIAPSAGGKHLDGAVEVTGGHGPDWIDPASPGFHAFAANEGLSSCQSCHGVNLDGVGGSTTVSCAQCHGPTWRSNCTMCHGGTGDGTGAPPKTTWGNSADLLRVGAHAKHVGGGSVGGPFDCSVCHPEPADALDAGHVGAGPATVTFAGLAASGGAVSPSWNRATGTCASNYCHGGYSGTYTYFFFDAYFDSPYAGAKGTPVWTDGPMTCTSCHGVPPTSGGTWHSGVHGGGNACSLCHPGVDDTGTALIDRSRHVDGVIDVTPKWTSRCFGCH